MISTNSYGRLIAIALGSLLASGCSDPCGPGTVEAADGQCAPAYPERTCGEGTVDEDGVCAPAYPERTCGPQTVEVDGHCLVDSNVGACSSGTILRGDSCVDAELQRVSLPFPAGLEAKISQGYDGIPPITTRSSTQSTPAPCDILSPMVTV